MKQMCRGEAGEWLDAETRLLWLHPVTEGRLNRAAGQYLKAELPGLGSAYYSIASPPGLAALELHVDTRSAKSRRLVELAERGEVVEVELPLGHCCLDEVLESPLLLVAGGTGVTQCLSMLSHLADRDSQQQAMLLWSASEAYLESCRPVLNHLQSRLALSTRLLPRQAPGIDPDDWLSSRLAEARSSHPAGQIFVCGSPALLETVLRYVPKALVSSDHLPKTARSLVCV